MKKLFIVDFNFLKKCCTFINYLLECKKVNLMIKKVNKRIIITLSQQELTKLKNISHALGYKTYTKAIKYLIKINIVNL